MNFGSYAGGRVDDALVRDTTRARASKTRSPTGGEPSPVPSAAKKRAYWVWFAAILCLETAMVRRSTIELNPESTGAVRAAAVAQHATATARQGGIVYAFDGPRSCAAANALSAARDALRLFYGPSSWCAAAVIARCW